MSDEKKTRPYNQKFLDEKEEHKTAYYLRVDQVVVLILSNDRFLHSKRTSELTEMVQKKFQCGDRQAARYIADAKSEVRAIGRKNVTKAFKKAIRDREYIIAASKDKKDLRTALQAMKDRDELNSLYTEQVEHKGSITLKGFNLEKLTEEELTIVEGMIKRGEDPRPYLISKGLFVGNA